MPWEKAIRRRKCLMCSEPIKGRQICYTIYLYRRSNIHIHAKHFKFKSCNKCNIKDCNAYPRCRLYKGVLNFLKSDNVTETVVLPRNEVITIGDSV
jgi:hypothetical protein